MPHPSPAELDAINKIVLKDHDFKAAVDMIRDQNENQRLIAEAVCIMGIVLVAYAVYRLAT